MSEKQIAVKRYFANDDIKKKFEDLLGKKTQGFITSCLQIVSSSSGLQNAEPQSIMNAAMMAAVLDLPIQQSLGFAYIVPYKGQAQFQIGWKGLVQLAQRTGQYEKINVIEVYKNQFKSYNELTEELEADFSIFGEGDIVGYCAYFKLLNGFTKVSYWRREKVEVHAKKYSQAYKSTSGVSPWKDPIQFHEMAKKTVLKNTISKYGPMSIELQKAVVMDQGVIQDVEHEEVTYPDNEKEQINYEKERVLQLMDLEYSSVEEFQKNVVNRMSQELREEMDLEIQMKVLNIENKGGVNE